MTTTGIWISMFLFCLEEWSLFPFFFFDFAIPHNGCPFWSGKRRESYTVSTPVGIQGISSTGPTSHFLQFLSKSNEAKYDTYLQYYSDHIDLFQFIGSFSVFKVSMVELHRCLFQTQAWPLGFGCQFAFYIAKLLKKFPVLLVLIFFIHARNMSLLVTFVQVSILLLERSHSCPLSSKAIFTQTPQGLYLLSNQTQTKLFLYTTTNRNTVCELLHTH